MRIRLINVMLPVAAIAFSVQARGDDAQTKVSREAWAAAGTKFGVSFVKILAGDGTQFPPNTGDATAQSSAIEKILNDYLARKERLETTAVGLKAIGQLAVDGTAATIALTGVGLVPAVMAKTAGQLAVDYTNSKIDAKISASIKLLLVKKRDEILQIAGGDMASLKDKTPEELLAALNQNSTVFRAMKATLPSDEGVRKLADELVVTGLINVTRESLERLSENSDAVANIESGVASLATGLYAFRASTEVALKKHNDSLVEMNTAIVHMASAIKSIGSRVTSDDFDKHVIAVAVFQQMSAAARSEALKSGFLAKKFECEDGETICPNSQLRQDLIEKAEAEAKIQKVYSDLNRSVNAMGDILTISRNFEIDIKGLDVAVNYGRIATKAFADYASGNYLGVLADVSTLFSTARPDPTMLYLQRQFEKVNKELAEIKENQQILLSAMKSLSDQMWAFQLMMDKRLGAIEFQTKHISAAVANLAWADWASCLAVYDFIVVDDRYGYVRFGDFRSAADMTTVLSTLQVQVARCIATAQEKTVTLGASPWFGNLFDVARLSRLPPDAFALAEKSDYTRSEFEVYENLHNNARRLLQSLNKTRGIPLSYSLLLLAHPSDSIWEYAKRFDRPTKPACGDAGYLGPSLSSLLCKGQGNNSGAEINAYHLLERPMTSDGALTIGSWVIAVSRFADLQKPFGPGFYQPQELLTAPSVGSSPGRLLISKMLGATDAAIASQALLSGDVMTRAVVDALFSATSPDRATEVRRVQDANAACNLIKANSYLASNAILLYLHDQIERRRGESSSSGAQIDYARPLVLTLRNVDAIYAKYGPSPSIADFLVTENALRSGLISDLQDTFGSSLSFYLPLQGKGAIRVGLSARHPCPNFSVAMPTPEEFISGVLVYPPQMARLLRQRQQLVERLLDYDFFSPLSDQEKQQLVIAVLRAPRP